MRSTRVSALITGRSIDYGNIVETTAQGTQAATALLAPAGGGALFGLAVVPNGSGIHFVDHSENQLNLFQ